MDIYFLPSPASHPGSACPNILIVCLITTKHHNAGGKRDNIIKTWAIFITFYWVISGIEMYALYMDDYLV